MLASTLLPLLLATPIGLLAADHSGENVPNFSSEVRPILSRHCLPCHGPDAKTRKADLRLDLKEGLLGVVEAGDLDASELVARITTTDLDDRMPPPEHSEALDAGEISTLSRWVTGGAIWQGHWSFTTPQLPEIPDQNRHNPIDA
ncbi:MAG: c-type cytochrome domain-containing protein, partial [Planctomycetota bacterium]